MENYYYNNKRHSQYSPPTCISISTFHSNLEFKGENPSKQYNISILPQPCIRPAIVLQQSCNKPCVYTLLLRIQQYYIMRTGEYTRIRCTTKYYIVPISWTKTLDQFGRLRWRQRQISLFHSHSLSVCLHNIIKYNILYTLYVYISLGLFYCG